MDMLTKHFSWKEMACRCGCQMIPTPELLDKLERLRVVVGKPFVVTSGARCPKHNVAVKGSKASQHMLGRAVDIACMTDAFRAQVLREAFGLGFRGVGLAKTFIHLDVREGEAVTFFY